MCCKADFKSIAKCKKWLCVAVFALFFKNTRRAAWPVLQSRCKAILAPPQSTPKNTKTGRKSVGFLILNQAPKCTRSHRFPPHKHPENGFVMRFAGKNSFLQVRSSHVLILSALLHLHMLLSNLNDVHFNECISPHPAARARGIFLFQCKARTACINKSGGRRLPAKTRRPLCPPAASTSSCRIRRIRIAHG